MVDAAQVNPAGPGSASAEHVASAATVASAESPSVTLKVVDDVVDAASTRPEETSNSADDDDVNLECTQQLPEDDVEVPKTTSSVPQASSSTATPVKAAAPSAVVDELFPSPDEPESVRRFTSVFGPLWSSMEAQGWQVAQGRDALFVSMPGTQFFNFRPNINVFDSKTKACWKWIASAAESDSKDDELIWESLWSVAEKHFGWYTMSSGPETWYVQPNTRFEDFQPNVTIFQTKKRAVLKCLAAEKIQIELGDSVEGHKVIDFSEPAPTKPASSAKKEILFSPAGSKDKNAADSPTSAFTTPPPKRSTTTKSSTAKKQSKKATPSSTEKTPKTATKKAGALVKSASKLLGKTPKGKNTKSANATPSPAPKKTPSKIKTPPLVFHVPEFKCTFGKVYEVLQRRGWYHRAGRFEYDYFSPDYTKETAILNGNYFQSMAELEGFLKDSGMWSDIENELREEHTALVEDLRQEAEAKRQKLKEKNLARSAADKAEKERAKAERAAKSAAKAAAKGSEETTKKSPWRPASASKRKSTFATDLATTTSFKVTIGKIVGKLVQRGWYYKPGRFEYDYFKPNVNEKNAKLNEDYFQSEAELETYLKVSGLWNEIAQELQDEFYASQEKEALRLSQEDGEEQSPAPKKVRRASHEPSPTSQPEEAATVVVSSNSAPQVEAEDEEMPGSTQVAALTNDIWANSNQFEFDE
ncbi:hypothetical protein P43SY_009963 [Pythium insidiosum]|uniref:Uncharacterized protein n=1 Tax=Pythium insidiosum TaxID=114742 RepID=A0AAD5Q6B5_PYTIN|nr:hypothetical protein P43SY_009963 [Pythium insidiosum]